MCNKIRTGDREFPFEEDGTGWKVFGVSAKTIDETEVNRLVPPFWYSKERYYVEDGWVRWDDDKYNGFCLFRDKDNAEFWLKEMKKGDNFALEDGYKDFVLREVRYKKCKNCREETSSPWNRYGKENVPKVLIVHEFKVVTEEGEIV